MGRAAGFVMLLGAGVVLASEVQVHEGRSAALACGSGWNAVSGTSGWSQWWSADLADPAQADHAPVRTVRCPAAVNRRIAGAGGIAVAAIVVVAAGEVVERGRSGWARPTKPSLRNVVGRLRWLGMTLSLLGSLLSAGGLIGLVLLVANPHSTLFLYVSRVVVVLTGLLLLLPAILLVALGRAAVLMADHLALQEVDHAET